MKPILEKDCDPVWFNIYVDGVIEDFLNLLEFLNTVWLKVATSVDSFFSSDNLVCIMHIIESRENALSWMPNLSTIEVHLYEKVSYPLQHSQTIPK